MPAVFQRNVPAAGLLAVMRGGNAALELDVAAQVELVGDVVQVTLGLRLAGEMLFPVPIVEQLLREGIAVGPAFGIKAGAGVAVPVLVAANASTGFKYPYRQAELPQLVELVEPGNAGADDDRVEVDIRLGLRLEHSRL